jgi:membrane-bound lytic murein transglycosylase A
MTRRNNVLNHHFLYFLTAMAALSCLSGCAGAPSKKNWETLPPLVQLSVSQYPHFSDDMSYEGITEAIRESMNYLSRLPRDKTFTFGEDRFNTGHMLRSLSQFMDFVRTRPSPEDLNRYIFTHYRVYQSKGINPEKEVLFTGYYEPILNGNPVKTIQYPYPVHSLPEDLLTIDLSLFLKDGEKKKIVGKLSEKTVIPYPDREQILEDPLFDDLAPPLAWVGDPVALFFLQVQGSGKISFPDGSGIRVHYRGTNGKPYRSVGKYLIDQGIIAKSDMSMQAIAAYLKSHPREIPKVLNYNPSYVFFEKVDKGPLGCIETQLVPGRSIALDRRIFPMAGLAFIEAWKPDVDGTGAIVNWRRFSRLVLNQDTGGAIKGAGRADIFWGGGQYAELAAGHLKHPGKMYFLVLKPEETSSP